MKLLVALCVLATPTSTSAFALGFGSRRLVQPASKDPFHGLEIVDAPSSAAARHARVATLAAITYPLQQLSSQPLWHTVVVLLGLAHWTPPTLDTTQDLLGRVAFLSAAATVIHDLMNQAGLVSDDDDDDDEKRRRRRKQQRTAASENDRLLTRTSSRTAAASGPPPT